MGNVSRETFPIWKKHSMIEPEKSAVKTQYPEISPSASPAEITFTDFTAGIAARGMDTFSANGPHIVADTSDFDQFDRRALLESVREFLRS